MEDSLIANLARHKEDLERLIKLGEAMEIDLIPPDLRKKLASKEPGVESENVSAGSFFRNYQRWYTEAAAVIRQLTPSRLAEFESHYEPDSKRKTVSVVSYTIQDWLLGVRAAEDFRGDKNFDDNGVALMRFGAQLQILKASAAAFESSLLDIRKVVHADLLDTELESARELLAAGFGRAAGVLVGVVLERHLSEVCGAHQCSIRKKHPTIGDYNEVLKSNGVVDVPTWRFIQRLADLRNLAAHNRDREPTKEEIEELIAGGERITKTLY
jgi:hypothetical protein